MDVCGPAQPHRAPNNAVEHGLDISRRARYHLQNLARCRPLLERLGQSVLQVCIRRYRRAALVNTCDGLTTLETELGVRWVVLLAPGTLHAGALQAAGPVKVGTVG